jgi:hypothetical protein
MKSEFNSIIMLQTQTPNSTVSSMVCCISLCFKAKSCLLDFRPHIKFRVWPLDVGLSFQKSVLSLLVGVLIAPTPQASYGFLQFHDIFWLSSNGFIKFQANQNPGVVFRIDSHFFKVLVHDPLFAFYRREGNF